MDWLYALIIGIGGLLFLLAIGMPVSFAFGITGVIAVLLTGGTGKLFLVAQLYHDTLLDFVLLTIPLFIFMAEVILEAGFTDALFKAFEKWVGRLPGGLALAAIATCSLFAAVCGSSWVSAATMGKLTIPELINRKYDKRMAAGTLAAGGTLGILIPPSLPFIIYGLMTETSIGHLFIAGIVPGIILSLCFCAVIVTLVTQFNFSAPPSEKSTWKERVTSLLAIWPVLSVALIVIGGIYLGVTTPTEAAAGGSMFALVISLVYRKMSWKGLVNVLTRTLYTTGFIMFLVPGAKIFAFFLADQGVPREIIRVTDFLGSPLLIILFTYAILTIAGMFLEGMSMLVLFSPILAPVFKAIGFDPIWSGVILIIFIEMAFLTPPVGMNCYIIRQIVEPWDISLTDVFKGALPFLIALFFVIFLITLIPNIVLWLPNTMK